MSKGQSSRYGEAHTATGQVVKFSCGSEDYDAVADIIERCIYTIRPTVTGKVTKTEGIDIFTRFDVHRHKYAGGNGGYIEVIEIKQPPDDRCGFILHERWHGEVLFTEWESLEDAIKAFDKHWDYQTSSEILSTYPGFRRRVECGIMTPWFYAVGNEILFGDIAFPENLQDDPVYRIGAKFIVDQFMGTPSVKTCVGTRFVEKQERFHPYTKCQHRLVYFDDGTVWDESQGNHKAPRPLLDGELWITEAIQKFRKLLAGNSTSVEIQFTNGSKFVGKVVLPKEDITCPEGDYELEVMFDSGESKTGWANGFVPTREFPDVVSFAVSKFQASGRTPLQIKIIRQKIKTGGKKWTGVFFKASG